MRVTLQSCKLSKVVEYAAKNNSKFPITDHGAKRTKKLKTDSYRRTLGPGDSKCRRNRKFVQIDNGTFHLYSMQTQFPRRAAAVVVQGG